MVNKELRRIYIDTNVLINYCTGQEADTEKLDYIFRTRRKEIVFTSSLALVQTISNLQTKKKTREAFTKTETETAIKRLTSKITVINLTADDVTEGLSLESKDIEDNIHYVLARKMKCEVILTNNLSDFSKFKAVKRISPQMSLSAVKRVIK